MIQSKTPEVAALVVGYEPDLPVLDALLSSLLDQVGLVIFVDNGGGKLLLSNAPEQRAKLRYLDLGANKGLGYALNRGMEVAVAEGYPFVATFDQDSAPPPGMIAALLEAHRGLREAGLRCAAVGPRFYDRREGAAHTFPLYKEVDGAIIVVSKNHSPEAGTLCEVDVLITSGMLIDTAVWQSGITYNAGLFGDYTDTDWCFRARAAGYRLYASMDVEMGHALSDAPPVRVLGVNPLRYSPQRRYYYFRNTLFFIRQPYVSKAWRKRLLAGLAVRFLSNIAIDKHKLLGCRMMLRGLLHGIQNKLNQP